MQSAHTLPKSRTEEVHPSRGEEGHVGLAQQLNACSVSDAGSGSSSSSSSSSGSSSGGNSGLNDSGNNGNGSGSQHMPSNNRGPASSRGSKSASGNVGRVFIIGGKYFNARGEEVDFAQLRDGGFKIRAAASSLTSSARGFTTTAYGNERPSEEELLRYDCRHT